MLRRALVLLVLLLSSSSLIAYASRSKVVIAGVDLEALPFEIDRWTGVSAGRFDDRTLAILGADQYINRTYRSAMPGPISLYVGFYASQREGDAMHSPLNCLPGSGWEPLEQSRATLPLSADSSRPLPVEVNRLIVQKGAVRQLVLYWYQAHGRVVASEYASKALTILDAISMNRSDGAIVRIMVPVAQDQSAPDAAARQFAAAVFPHLTAALPR